MKKLIAIGEALIDFIPAQTGRLQDVTSFEPHVGGAPCNVCGAFARLGGTSAMITQLGQDGFGDKIVSELKTYGVDTAMIERTSEAEVPPHTALPHAPERLDSQSQDVSA